MLSIRLRSNGQSFSLSGLPTGTDIIDSPVSVEVDTLSVVAMPEQEGLTPQMCFEAEGIALESDDILIDDTQGDCTVVMAVSTEAVKTVIGRCVGEVSYHSPLSETIRLALANGTKKVAAVMFFTPSSLYCAVACKGRLLYAEALPCNTDNDLLYYSGIIGREFELNGGCVYTVGHNALSRAKFMGRYFKHCKCV